MRDSFRGQAFRSWLIQNLLINTWVGHSTDQYFHCQHYINIACFHCKIFKEPLSKELYWHDFKHVETQESGFEKCLTKVPEWHPDYFLNNMHKYHMCQMPWICARLSLGCNNLALNHTGDGLPSLCGMCTFSKSLTHILVRLGTRSVEHTRRCLSACKSAVPQPTSCFWSGPRTFLRVWRRGRSACGSHPDVCLPVHASVSCLCSHNQCRGGNRRITHTWA